MKKAVIAGSFDPFTLGHKELYLRARSLFDTVIIGVAACSEKKVLPAQNRVEIIKACLPDAEVVEFDGLLTDFLTEQGADVLVRGIRNTVDFEYERGLEAIYKGFCNVEIVYMTPSLESWFISSSAVRELIKAGGNISRLVDTKAEKLIKKYYGGFGNENKPSY